MKQVYRRAGKRIDLPWGGVNKMCRKLKIGKQALGRILDGQLCSKWQFEYSFEEIRKMAIDNFHGYIRDD